MLKVYHLACWINLRLKVFNESEKFLISLKSFVRKKCIKKGDHCAEVNNVNCIKLLKKINWGGAKCSIGEIATTVTEKVKFTLSTKYTCMHMRSISGQQS